MDYQHQAPLIPTTRNTVADAIAISGILSIFSPVCLDRFEDLLVRQSSSRRFLNWKHARSLTNASESILNFSRL